MLKIEKGLENTLVHLYLRVPQAAGHGKRIFWYFWCKCLFSIYANNFCDAGQLPILRYFEACRERKQSGADGQTFVPTDAQT